MSFTGDIAKFSAKVEKLDDDIVHKIVFDISSKLVYRTPVGDPKYWKSAPPPGYVGGRARGNWQYAIGAPNTAETGAIDGSGSDTLDNVTSGIPQDAGNHSHYITNTLPYIERLEEGYSRQAPPQGIVALTVMEFQSVVQAAVSEFKK